MPSYKNYPLNTSNVRNDVIAIFTGHIFVQRSKTKYRYLLT